MRAACVAVLALITSLPLAASPTASYAAARGSGHSHFKHSCRPTLKFAAGACVRRCLGGFADRGRYCRYRNKGN